MIHVIDARLRDEARRFHLRFACPDCASFDAENGRCSLGFPPDPHIDPHIDEARVEIVFCKAFELV